MCLWDSSQDDHAAQVDAAATRSETNFETFASTNKAKKHLATLGPRYPQRPGFGTQGRAVVLWTNHLHLAFDGDLQLFRYSITFLAEQGGRPPAGKKAKRVIQLLLEEHFPQQVQSIATDFKAVLVSKNHIEVAEEYTVVYRSEGEEDPAPNARRYRVRLDATGSVTVSESPTILHLPTLAICLLLKKKPFRLLTSYWATTAKPLHILLLWARIATLT